MIIDCHGHYTTTPPQIEAYRNEQRALLAKDQNHIFAKGHVTISDDEIRDSIVNNQLKVQQDRGTDVTIFSPRASWMGQDLGNASTSEAWTGICNDLIRRVCDLFPKNFVPVCQLPQSPGTSLDASITELTRCVEEMGFIGCNLNPTHQVGFGKILALVTGIGIHFMKK